MKIFNLKTKKINQNYYHQNIFTRNKIGALYTFPKQYTPEDCLACDGYILKIVDFSELYEIFGTTFNSGEEAKDEFRIPDYNLTGRFLQPGTACGTKIEAGIPDHTHTVTALYWDANGIAEEGRGSPDYGHQKALTTSKASANNSIYGKSKTVQPPSQVVHISIRYK